MTNKRGIIIPCQIFNLMLFKGLYQSHSPLNLFWWGEGILYYSNLSKVDELLTWLMRTSYSQHKHAHCTCAHTHTHTFLHKVLHNFVLFRASLSKPYVCDNTPTCGIMLCLYHFYPAFSHTGSWDPCMPWKPRCISVYWHAHVRDLQLLHSTEQQGRLELLESAVKIIDENRKVNAQTHDINGFSLLRLYSLATCQRGAFVNQKRLLGWLYCCFVTLTKVHTTLNLPHAVPAWYLWM